MAAGGATRRRTAAGTVIDLRTAVIMGIDPSMTATGVARYQRGRWTFATIRTNTRTGIAPYRWHIITRSIRELMPYTPGPVYMAVEEYPWLMLKKGARGAVDRLGLRGVLLHNLFEMGIDYVEVSPTAVKAFAGGGNLDKTQMRAAACDALRQDIGQEVMPADSHQADAFWIAQMYVTAASLAREWLTPARQQALSTVEWPGVPKEE